MRVILFTGLVALLAFGVQSLFPWWTLIIPPVLLGLFVYRKGNEAFFSSFLGLLLLWIIHAGLQHATSSGDMAARMASTFGIPIVVLLLATGVVGGLLAGLAGLSGFYLQRTQQKKRRN